MESTPNPPKPSPLTLSTLAGLSLLSGLFPSATPWIGIGFLLLRWAPPHTCKAFSCLGAQSAACLMLLQKVTSISTNQNGIYPVGIFLALWATQWYLSNPILKWSTSNPATYAWPLILFLGSTSLLKSLYSPPWDYTPSTPWETLGLGLLLLTHTKTAFPLLYTTFFACFWSLTSSPEILEPLKTLTANWPLIPNHPLLPQWNSLCFPAKNPGAALSALCVSWLLLHSAKLNTLCAALLTALISLQNSVGSLAIVLLVWCIHLLWTPLAKLPIKTRGLVAAIALLLATLTYQFLPELLKSQDRDIRASGRVPACLHILQQWIPLNPGIGENPTFRLTPSGNLSESIYLLSLKRTPTCNNVFVESLIQYGIPITCLLGVFLALVLKTPTTLREKTLLAAPLILVLNYSATGPFNWDEQGVLWVIAALIPVLAPPENPSPTPCLPQKKPFGGLLSPLCALALGILLWSTLKISPTSWTELWETPLTVRLADKAPSPLPQNHGAHIDAQDVLSTYQSLGSPEGTRLRRPYLSNLLHVETPTPEIAQNLRLKIQEKSQTPLDMVAGGWTHKNSGQNIALLLAPLALLGLIRLSAKFPLPFFTGCLCISVGLLLLGELSQHKKPRWHVYSLLLEHHPPLATESRWAYIWRREITKTSSGEALQFLLARANYPSDFFFEKSTSPKPRAHKPEKTLIKIKTLAPKETLEEALEKLPQLRLLPSKEVDSENKSPKKRP